MMKYTMLSSIETIFSVILCFTLKIGKEKTRLSGTTLRYVYRFEKNLLYNYEFGKYTKVGNSFRVGLKVFFESLFSSFPPLELENPKNINAILPIDFAPN